jgi:hypothetical protein
MMSPGMKLSNSPVASPSPDRWDPLLRVDEVWPGSGLWGAGQMRLALGGGTADRSDPARQLSSSKSSSWWLGRVRATVLGSGSVGPAGREIHSESCLNMKRPLEREWPQTTRNDGHISNSPHAMCSEWRISGRLGPARH